MLNSRIPDTSGHDSDSSIYYRYEPRVHVIKFSDPGQEGNNGKHVDAVFMRSFPPARFITVTAYQNKDVTELKVKYNRYAGLG